MRITDLDIIVTAPPAPGWGGRYWILVKLTTDTKVVGWGECYASSVGPAAMAAVIEDVFQRYFLDQSPENIELIFRRTFSSGFTQRPDLSVMVSLGLQCMPRPTVAQLAEANTMVRRAKQFSDLTIKWKPIPFSDLTAVLHTDAS